jgi:hypothetical protein
MVVPRYTPAVPGKSYITVVRWPTDYTPKDRLEALAEAMGIDPYMAGLRAVQDPPFVAGRVDDLVASDIVARFKARKVLAFALSQTNVERLPRPQLIKRLVPADGAAEPMYMVELWRGEPTGLNTSDIFLLVRGTVDKSILRTQVSGGSASRQAGGLATIAGAGFGVVLPGPVEVSHSTDSKLSQLLDIYLSDHTLLRINSDRVSWDVLGKQRAFTAAENTDKIAMLLGSQAPRAIIDTGFARFKAPADLDVETFSGGGSTTTRQRDQSSAFDFYSGWIYTINRGLSRR